MLEPDFTNSPVFGYYSYLIFTEQSSLTYPLRKEAARAFMCQLQESDRSKVIGINTKNMAVLYAPVNPDTAADIKQFASSEILLKHYNYAFAQKLIGKISEQKPVENFTVGIIAHPVPLSTQDNGLIMLDELEIIDLSDMSPVQIGAVIRKLRQAVLDTDQIKAIRIPEQIKQDIAGLNMDFYPVPFFVDVIVKDFPAAFRTMLVASARKLLPQVETLEAATITCK